MELRTEDPAGRVVVLAKGPPRAGTTLFDLVLGAHPLGFSLGELEQFGRADRTVARRGRLCGVCETRCPFWEERVPAGFGARWFGKSVLARRLAGLASRRGLYEELFEAAGRPRFLVDSSKPVAWTDRRLADPRDWRAAEARFLLITRDGRAVLNSWRRKAPGIATEAHLDRWRRIVDDLEDAHARFTGPKTRVAYEDLANDPEAVAARLARFAGVEPDPLMTRYWEADHHLIGGNVGTRSLILRHRAEREGGAIPFAPSSAAKTAYYEAQGLAIRLDERWRDELPEADLETFERLAGERNRPYRFDAAASDGAARDGATGEGSAGAVPGDAQRSTQRSSR